MMMMMMMTYTIMYRVINRLILTIHTQAGNGRFTETDGRLLELLRTRSLPQIKAIFNKYKSVSMKGSHFVLLLDILDI